MFSIKDISQADCAETGVAKVNEAELVRIRSRLSALVQHEIANTIKTDRVCLSYGKCWDQMHLAIEYELLFSEEDARVYAMSSKRHAARKNSTPMIRVATPLTRLRSHVFQTYKEVVIHVYMEAMGVPVQSAKKKVRKRKRCSGATGVSELPLIEVRHRA